MVRQVEIVLPQYPRGFHLITREVARQLGELPETGLLNLLIKHTSAGLTVNENADPTVRIDFETVFNRLVPEGVKEYVHTLEGADDMPAHIKSSLVGHVVTIPITHGQLNLGTWQGIYLCEFRNRGGRRKLTATICS
jgi:secondary thiamine-phosphate synthase enzyme